MDVISNSIIIPIINPRSVEVLVSTSITLLRVKRSQLASFLSLLLLINRYSDSIVIVTNLCPYITITS